MSFAETWDCPKCRGIVFGGQPCANDGTPPPGRVETVPPSGRKDDDGKPRWSLLPFAAVRLVVDVLEHGARKYAPDNWRKVPDARRRYFDAAARHLIAWWGGEKLDQDSGLPHLAHAACCLLFLLDLEISS